MLTGWVLEAPDDVTGLLAAVIASRYGARVESITYRGLPATATRYTWSPETGARMAR